MKNETTRFLKTSLILVLTLCVVTFTGLAVIMNRKSSDTISRVGLTYMEGMSQQVSQHFATTMKLRLEQMEAFVEMMNAQAMELMATNSHFMNSNGLHNEDHYTTAYDLYLIFNACITYQEFIDIIQSDSYTASVTRADGSVTEMVWEPTHFYASGKAEAPTGGSVIGGKTGFTDQDSTNKT